MNSVALQGEISALPEVSIIGCITFNGNIMFLQSKDLDLVYSNSKTQYITIGMHCNFYRWVFICSTVDSAGPRKGRQRWKIWLRSASIHRLKLSTFLCSMDRGKNLDDAKLGGPRLYPLNPEFMEFSLSVRESHLVAEMDRTEEFNEFLLFRHHSARTLLPPTAIAESQRHPPPPPPMHPSHYKPWVFRFLPPLI